VDRLVRRYLKTAIGFLGLGLGLGGLMIVRRELQGVFPSPHWISAHTHALLVGFVMMMIQGVALWMFPRPEKADPRYRPALAEAAYWLVALSTAVRLAGELFRPATEALAVRGLVAGAGIGQVLGILVFFLNMWPRIRAAGARVR
jgi:cbb3-type cytochrome oxidase subunit 1